MKIVYAARGALAFLFYVAILGADGFMDNLGIAGFLGLYTLLFAAIGICLYCSELRGVHTLRRFFRRVSKMYGKHPSTRKAASF